jgi:hypothetical protein
MWDNSAMFRRLAILDRTFIFGEGIKVVCEDEAVQKIVDDFWTDPENELDLNLPDWFMWLSILGEQCWPMEVNAGRVTLGYLDPFNIRDIYVGRTNSRQLGMVLGKDILTMEKREFRIIQRDKDPAHKKSFGRLMGDCFFFSINHPPNSPRGRSDFRTLYDWIDSLERYGFNYLDRAELMLNFIWDITLNGLSQEQIKDWVSQNPPPEPGSVRAHNENVAWQAVTPDLKATDFRAGFDMGKSYIMGASGRPDSWFGSGGKAYQTEADLMGQVPIKDLDERQKYIKKCISQVIQFVIDQAIIAGRMSSGANAGFRVEMPEISKKDLTKIAGILPQVTNSLAIAQDNGWVTAKTSSRVICSVIQQFGEEIDSEKEFEEAQKEKDETSYQDYLNREKIKEKADDQTADIRS